MKVYMSEEILSKAKFSVKKFDRRITINGCKKDLIEEDSCLYCSLKTFKKSETILIDEIKEERKCLSRLKNSLLISIKLDIQKNKSIIIWTLPLLCSSFFLSIPLLI